MRLEDEHEWGANKDLKEVIIACLKILSKNSPDNMEETL
jgi:hypothetical protein